MPPSDLTAIVWKQPEKTTREKRINMLNILIIDYAVNIQKVVQK